jgi:AcrR family transcriptional regulator
LTDRSVNINMPRSQEQFEQIRRVKKKLILDTALFLFVENGYTTTSISQIAAKAGISKGLLYNYFTSKEAVLQAIMHDLVVEFSDMINPNHDDEITLDEATRFIEQYFEMLINRREQLKLFIRLALQPQVVSFLLNYNDDPVLLKQQETLFSFFTKNTSIDPMISLVTITSLLKGFTLQYVFAPTLYSEAFMHTYKEFLINLLIKPTTNTVFHP